MITKVQITHLSVDRHFWLLRKTILSGRAQVSPTLVCSMSRFLCTVRTYFWSVPSRPTQSPQLVTHIISHTVMPPHMPIFLHHSVSCRPSDIEHVCPTVRPCLGNTDRGGGKEQTLRLGMKEPPYCTAYTLLPHSLSPHNVLLKTKYVILQSAEWFSNQQCVVLTKSQRETEQQ